MLNEAPTANDDIAVTDEEMPVTVNVLDNDSDADGDSLSVSVFDAAFAIGEVVDNGDGTFTYTPAAGFTGTDSFEYSVSDGNGGTAQGTVNVTVNDPTDSSGDDDSGGGGGAIAPLTGLLLMSAAAYTRRRALGRVFRSIGIG